MKGSDWLVVDQERKCVQTVTISLSSFPSFGPPSIFFPQVVSNIGNESRGDARHSAQRVRLQKKCTRTEVRILPPLIVPGTSVFRSSRRKHVEVPRIISNCVRDLAAAPEFCLCCFFQGLLRLRWDRQTDG